MQTGFSPVWDVNAICTLPLCAKDSLAYRSYPGARSMHSVTTASLFQARPQQRMLLGCVLASVALHAALLSLSPGLRHHRAPVGFLTATLVTPVATLEPAKAQPAPAEARQPPRKREQRERAAAAPRSAPRTAASLESPARESEQPEIAPEPMPATGVPVAGANSGGAATAQAVPVPAAPSRLPAGPDAGNVDQYRLALMGAAKRYKRYPSQAVENGWTGRVEVRLVVARDGGVETVRVKNSSGYAVLDDQALDMIRRAEGVTPIPSALQGLPFSVDIPVVFDLQTG